MSAIPLIFAKFYKQLLLLMIFITSSPLHGSETYKNILKLVNNGNLQQAELLSKQQLSAPSLSIDDEILYLAILGDIKFYGDAYVAAIEFYQQAVVKAKKTQNLKQVAEQYKNIAIGYSHLREYGESLRWQQKAWLILNKNNWKNSDIALSILLSQSSLYGYIGAYEQSLETIAKAQRLAIKLNNLSALSDSYVRVAALHSESNNYQAAINQLKLVDITLMNDRSSLGWYYSLYSEALIALNQSDQAQRLIEKAIDSKIQWTAENLHAFEVILLESYLQQQDIELAEQSIRNFKTNKENFETSWLLYYLQAQKFKLENKHKLSFDSNIQAISLFFKYDSWNRNSDKSLFFEIPLSLIEATIEDAMDIGLSDSNLIFELYYLAFLAKQPIQVKSGHDSTLKKINGGLAESAVINDILFGEASLNFSDRFKLAELQSEMNSDEGFVFYLSIEDKYYAMLVTQTALISTKLKLNFIEINNLVIQLLTHLEADNNDWIKTAHKLDSILINPLRNLGLEPLKTVHFIQDENLRFLPMDVLIDDQGSLLIDRHDIAINTVKTLKKHLQTRIKAKSNSGNQSNSTALNLVGISEGKLDIPSYWHTAYRNLNMSKNNLPHVNKELKHLEAEFSNSSLTMANQATETRAKNIISNAKGILHFASHGFDNPVAPAYSSLVLKSDNNNDGLLQAREISNLTTDAELVVLASCSSAKGGLSGLYGYNSGLAESFIFAGAKTVIGTLWDVKDQTTYKFMQWFYQGVSQQFTTSKALNYAKKQARQSGWKTYDWAGFILLGQTDLKLNLQTNNSYNWLYYSIIIIIVLMTILYLKKYRTFSKNSKK